MKNDSRVQGMIGLAQRAGKISSGATQVKQDIKNGRAALVIIAHDASKNTFKDFCSSCEHYQVPILRWGDKDRLGHIIGKPFRTIIAVRDKGFANRIKQLLLGEMEMD